MLENQEKLSTPILISLIPNLMEGEGHIIPYHQAVNQAIKKLGWKHLVVVPSQGNVANLPREWEGYLSNDDLEKEGNTWQKIIRLIGVWKLGKSIARYLKDRVINQSDHSIIFLERFIHLQLFALAISLWLVPPKTLSVWLLYRRDTHKDKTRSIYKLLNNIIKTRLPKGQFKLLTDSDLLSKSLSIYFQESVIVMPIPHTEIKFCTIHNKDPNFNILCWWPGSPREEKGLDKIQQLVRTSCENTKSNKICLAVAKSSNLEAVKAGIQVKLIDNKLTREEYNYWLSISDTILLPYDFQAYGERTSGIFTECIIAGKIPLVTEKTWMAHELLKYNLGELIINWEEPKQVFLSIINIVQNINIKNKIKLMQKSYNEFHCLDKYAEIMKKLVSEK
ncbi:MAG TPA: hypothetical protein DCF68_14050 [Cyanothece sp. UBA12306]|nr:hypothetical protein [Cyanothece sp. UBA12306]